MAKDDFEVIVYKVLAYLYACLKAGVEASPAKAREVAGCNDVYWKTVLEDMAHRGLVRVGEYRHWGGSDVTSVSITMDGAGYLSENSRMAAVRGFLGTAFTAIVEGAVAATMAL
jgi:hypothetical protein